MLKYTVKKYCSEGSKMNQIVMAILSEFLFIENYKFFFTIVRCGNALKTFLKDFLHLNFLMAYYS